MSVIRWRKNPFYSDPAFPTVDITSGFRRLCEDAINFLGEICAQIAADVATLEDDKLVSLLKKVFLDLNLELESPIDDSYISAKNVVCTVEPDLVWTACPRCRECGSRLFWQMYKTNVRLPSKFRPADRLSDKLYTDNDSLLDNLYSVAIALASEFNHHYQNQTDLEGFCSEFKSLIQELDSLLGLCNQSQGFKSEKTLKENNKETVELANRIPLVLGEPEIRSSSISLPKESLCFDSKYLLSDQDSLIQKNHPLSYLFNNNINTLSENSTITENSDLARITKLFYENEEVLVLDCNYERAYIDKKIQEPFLRGRSTESKLSVVLEESIEWSGTESDSSDVVAWKQDLWQSALDDSDDDSIWFQQQWFSSNDGEGRLYFFEENSNQSSWTLPKHDLLDLKEKTSGLEQKTPPNNGEGLMINPVPEKNLGRKQKSKSGFDLRHESSVSSLSSQNWPQLWEGHMAILKEGPLNKTKITENGKRLRKNWTTMHAVLTELLLLFFKDNKGYPAMLSGSGHPELSVDLNGAKIDNGDKMSSRHNVYLLSTVLGLQVLIQSDCATLAAEWLIKIQSAIDNLPSSSINVKGPRLKADTPPNETKSSALVRSKSIKSKQKSVSIEDLSNTNISERQTKIKERLKRFFHMRPSVEILVKKGILKDEPVFGCVLEQICSPVEPRVPRIVLECIRCIERSNENMKTDGLYRASGNLSQVQKIRCQVREANMVDQHQYGLLDLEEDVHVLTGTLKLFFRELKQPIIPFKFFKKALNASTNQNRNEKIKHFQEIVKSLPPCNHDTLKCLIQHLLRVTQFQEFNRMHIPNIAIVFGPTLMWPEQESQNMACDLMQQNLVIECLLSDFSLIFR